MYRMRNRLLGCFFVLFMFLAAPLFSAAATAPLTTFTADEARIKARYLYNFMKFVEWPPSMAGREMIVCVLGSNPFGRGLDNLATRKIGEQGIRVLTDVPLEQARYCHVVYISASEQSRLVPSLLNLQRYPVLTVSDIEGFAEKGGVIEIMGRGLPETAFRINQENAEKAGLRVSSKLLSLSR